MPFSSKSTEPRPTQSSKTKSSSSNSESGQGLLASGIKRTKNILTRTSSEVKDVEPTVYLVILNPELSERGLSWTIRIHTPDEADEADYVFCIRPDSKQGFSVHIDRPQNAILKSSFFTTIKIGTISGSRSSGSPNFEHVLNGLRTYPLDKSKPHAVSIIWAREVLTTSSRTEILTYDNGVAKKIEQLIRQMEKRR